MIHVHVNALSLLEKLKNKSPKNLAAVCWPTVHQQLAANSRQLVEKWLTSGQQSE